MDKPTRYQSYLLRLWRDGAQGPWRASLQSTATGHVRFFADTGEVWGFIQAQLTMEGEGPDAQDGDLGESGRGPPL
jgi:hypothetical protein